MSRSGIAKADGRRVLLKKGGATGDIVKTVLDTIPNVQGQTKEFAKKFSPTRSGLYELWAWIRGNIDYIEDPLGVQWIREPARLWHDRQGDCKSFTVFAVSVLENMGLDYIVRFSNTETPGSKKVNHVYPIAILPNGEKVIIDSVYPAFNREKSFFYAIDYTMPDIYRLSGIGSASTDQAAEIQQYLKQVQAAVAEISDDVLQEDITQMSKGDFARYQQATLFNIQAQNATSNAERKRFSMAATALKTGDIGRLGSVAPDDAAKINAFLRETAMQTGPAFQAPVLALPDNMAGIGSLVDIVKEAWRKLVNWIFKTAMPAAAPYFLYVFLKKSIGPKTDRKRQKQMAVLSWIQTTGKFDSQQAVINAANIGIQKQYKMSPQQLLNSVANGKQIAGDGVGWITVAIQVVTALVEIISKISAVFKKNKVDASQADVANPQELSAEVAAQGLTTNDISNLPPSSGDGGNNNILMFGALALGAFVLLSK